MKNGINPWFCFGSNKFNQKKRNKRTPIEGSSLVYLGRDFLLSSVSSSILILLQYLYKVVSKYVYWLIFTPGPAWSISCIAWFVAESGEMWVGNVKEKNRDRTHLKSSVGSLWSVSWININMAWSIGRCGCLWCFLVYYTQTQWGWSLLSQVKVEIKGNSCVDRYR